MNYLKWLLGIVVIFVISFSLFLISMSFHDGPMEIFAGGTFKTGNLVSGPEPDWNEIKDRATIQLQSIEPPRSRVTWLAVIDGKLYVSPVAI